ncbi:methionine--tRNA ligase [bacterium SCSIO 12643]|nr:methionine--tRNA ligase [bacterium SCSIO 12643]
MTSNPKRHLVTSALPYANGPLHIGHIAGAYLPADIYVKFLRMNEEDVVFVCGSDEHGAAITLRAKKEGITPQEIVDKYHDINKKAFADFGIDFDIYHRTSSELHHETASEFFLKLVENDVFEVEESEQFYDEEFNQFLADRYVTGTCPKCGNENAYGDQCEKCGTALSPTELIDPKSTLSGKTPKMKTTKHWYLPMNRDEEWLKEWIKTGKLDGEEQHVPAEWRNQVLGQCMSWIDGGLGARAMTRDLDWGVPVPLKDADGKVLYVWLDAPIGYISATKQWAKDKNKNWEDYWVKDENTHLTHFIAKDNIVFHAIIFPILLKAHGNLNLPYNVPANEFLNLEGDKISTSREWAVWLHEYISEFEGKEDELRYVLTSIAPENKDSEFTWKDYQARVNNELVAILGNFVNRSLVLTNKYYGGVMPELGELTEVDQQVLNEMAEIPVKIAEKIKAHKYREALSAAMYLARLGNKYLADTEPWKLAKTDPKRVETILHVSNQIVANLAIVLRPFLPHTSDKLNTFLNQENKNWNVAGKSDLLPAGAQFQKPGLLFSKIEDELIEKQVEKLNVRKAEKEKESQKKEVLSQKENISFDDFLKMDVRIGKVLEAEKVKKADKLLKLKVDTGLDIRTIVSGIAQQFSPEEIVNKQVTVLMNLPPRKIRGVVSEGMLLMAENEKGELGLVSGDSYNNPGDLIG